MSDHHPTYISFSSDPTHEAQTCPQFSDSFEVEVLSEPNCLWCPMLFGRSFLLWFWCSSPRFFFVYIEVGPGPFLPNNQRVYREPPSVGQERCFGLCSKGEGGASE